MSKKCRRGSVSVQKNCKQSVQDEIAADYKRRIAELRKKQIKAAESVLAALNMEDDL